MWNIYALIGAGGHGKVILDMLIRNKEDVLGFVDDFSVQPSLKGFPLLGTLKDIPELMSRNPALKFIISVGDNFTRKEISIQLEPLSVKYGTAVHPTAHIGSGAAIGEGTVVMPYAVINTDAVVGSHCIVNTHCVIEHDCRIDSFVHAAPQTVLTGNIGVQEGVLIGAGASIIPGVTIGKWSIIGAGSTVIKDIPPYSNALGSPAKISTRKGGFDIDGV
ncbi:acetyltransferase [Falsibacillus albus]|uniref:Acetyltransferase n=1 Tax=Falsibacillus albus TaxID=2478915 RepID=A0A3L7K3D2_9BACI|nr:acetyltransferase [Falsibacillus albus]RLQ97145.1 acetyltransferase [Falsibacillus albus]